MTDSALVSLARAHRDAGHGSEDEAMEMAKIADPLRMLSDTHAWIKANCDLQKSCLKILQELETNQVIPEGALDRFKKQSRAAHSEPLKFLQHFQSALKVGLGCDVDIFAPGPAPAPGQAPLALKKKTLVITADEEPKQPASQQSVATPWLKLPRL